MHTHNTPAPGFLEKLTGLSDRTVAPNTGRLVSFTRRDRRILGATRLLPEHLRVQFLHDHPMTFNREGGEAA